MKIVPAVSPIVPVIGVHGTLCSDEIDDRKGGRGVSESQWDPAKLAVETYVYLYPLVTMEVTRRQATNVESGRMQGRGPMGSFTHIRAFPDADFKMVVRPNFDTLYSSAFLDLSSGPVRVSVPDTAGRYYLLPMLDMWTDVFAVPGWRTTGTGAASFAITAPGWSGALPTGVQQIAAPTPTIWIIGRVQTNGPADYPAVRAIQDGITATPLTGEVPAFVADPSVDMDTPPLQQVDAMTGRAYFALAAELLRVHPPHPTDYSMLQLAARVGIVPGRPFDASSLDASLLASIDAAPAAAQALMRARIGGMGAVANGWNLITDTIGVYGNFYLKRAIVAQAGLGANPAEDAIYPLAMADGDGRPITGEHDYVLRFPPGQTPPVHGFWSLTMYDAEGFQVPNQLNRFALGDRDPLVYGADGSLELFIQQGDPGAGKQANWLPSAPGRLGLTLRLYAPRSAALDGSWVPPAVIRTK